jgi:DNA-binding XRE family transcriptional regulator
MSAGWPNVGWMAEANHHRPPAFRVRCRACGHDLNQAVARPEDDRQVYCLACLAAHPEASFTEHLRAYRLAAGLTASALAARAGVPQSTLSCLEHARSRANWETAAKLLRALGVRLVYGPARDGKSS